MASTAPLGPRFRGLRAPRGEAGWVCTEVSKTHAPVLGTSSCAHFEVEAEVIEFGAEGDSLGLRGGHQSKNCKPHDWINA